MSNLLSQASLVMIPSGYAEDIVYSEIPLDGSGDLQLTRASNGTRTNSAGLVEDCPWNLAKYSEDFANAIWESVAVSVTANTTTAPNGTLTADTATISTYAGHNLRQLISVVPNTAYTFTFYVKRGTATDMKYSVYNNTGNQNIVSPTSYYSQTSSSQWSQITVSFTTPSNCTNVYIYPLRDSDSTGTVFLWGAQLNIGSTAKPYFPTTDRLNVPRLTYQNGGGGCPSLLLEKQSTNLVSYSEEFDNAAWNKYQCSISANQTTSPDGTQNADKLTLSGNSGTYTGLVYRIITTGANSIYMKNDSIGNGKFYIQVDGVGNAKWNTDGTLNSVTGGTATNGENMGNGWFRFTFVVTSGSYINYGIVDGTTGDSIYIWGAQLEASSYPTSYIPTTSASATRVGDNIANTFLQSGGFLGSATGAMFVSGSTYSLGNTICNFVLTAQDNTTKSFLFDTVGSAIRLRSWDASSNLQSLTSGTITNNYKLCVSWTSSSIKFFVNGSLIGTISQTTYPYSTISQESTSFSNNIWNELVFFPTALTDAEAISLTTL